MPAEAQTVSEKRTKHWKGLEAFIRGQGGCVVSPPSGRFMRAEIPQDSPLPTQLIKAGYHVTHHGINTRIGANGFSTVSVIGIDLER